MVGLVKNEKHITTMEFKYKDDFIVALGSLNGQIGGSEYLKLFYDKIEGPIANINMTLERKVQDACLESIEMGIINSAHDLSDGGLAVNISESILFSDKGLGAEINLSRKLRNDELLFGECQSVIIVTIKEENLYDLIAKAQELGVYTQTIGKVVDSPNLRINDLIDLDRDSLSKAYFKSFEEIMEN